MVSKAVFGSRSAAAGQSQVKGTGDQHDAAAASSKVFGGSRSGAALQFARTLAYLRIADPGLAERGVLPHQLLKGHPGLVVLLLPAELQGMPAGWGEGGSSDGLG